MEGRRCIKKGRGWKEGGHGRKEGKTTKSVTLIAMLSFQCTNLYTSGYIRPPKSHIKYHCVVL